MSKLDDLMKQALSKEDQELLARHGEPGYFAQAFGLFRGPLSWVIWLVYAVILVASVLSFCAFWQVYISADALSAVKWATLGLVLAQVVMMGKNFMAQHLETGRMLREIKRVELQVSLLRAAGE
ncbi:MAG: DUF6768 family protein [Lysobacterales bacterium]